MADDYLKDLPGSQAAPELARALTLNVYASEVRRLKRRNLQQAAQPIVAFMREHPDLFVGVNLDPDVYINPFFSETQWYDYNPGTLRQFREWLAGAGPYAGAPLRRRCRTCRASGAQPPLVAAATCRASRGAHSRRGTTSIRRAHFRATPRCRSGTTRGCMSGRCSAAIW